MCPAARDLVTRVVALSHERVAHRVALIIVDHPVDGAVNEGNGGLPGRCASSAKACAYLSGTSSGPAPKKHLRDETVLTAGS